ncbi:CGNR zinc finger domain-containing protein [Streptomyces sp. NRRL F-5755]|uniref:CGNR zinc finger domain-containing protein n=1 Tax=Streptomyces sp. NRRL F-5755 TaxID=1519475 RepID=UPI003B6394F3
MVQTAVDLANTLRPVKGEDALETVEQLRDFLDDHPVAEPPSSAANRRTGPRHLTRADLAEVRALRETLREVLEQANTDAAEAAALINDGLRRSRATPVLRSALASVIATLGPARLGVCAGPTCRATFVDLSRNGSKQYCTRTCSHRASVAAYRSRRSPR